MRKREKLLKAFKRIYIRVFFLYQPLLLCILERIFSLFLFFSLSFSFTHSQIATSKTKKVNKFLILKREKQIHHNNKK